MSRNLLFRIHLERRLWQTSDSSWPISNKHLKKKKSKEIVKDETSMKLLFFPVDITNIKRQLKQNLGHLAQIDIRRFLWVKWLQISRTSWIWHDHGLGLSFITGKRLGDFQSRQCASQQHIPLHTVSVLTHVLDTSYKVLTRAPTRVQ